LSELHVAEGQQVAAGDLICTLETTKSTAEVEAERDGYIVGLRYAEGDTVRAGEVLAYISDQEIREQETKDRKRPSPAPQSPIPDHIRASKAALELARRHNLDLSQFPAERFITEAMVRARLERGAAKFAPPQSEFDPTALVIYGGGGHGKSLLELVRALGTYTVVGFVDDGLPEGEQILGVPVLGGGDVLPELYARGVRLAVNAVGGIGNVAVRVRVFERIAAAGLVCPAVVHPTAFLEPSAKLSPGAQVFPHAYVGSEARVGYGCIVNTGAIVSHDCTLGDYVNLSPGAILAGEVTVGDGALIGMGVTVNLGVTIGAGARVGNGATVKSDVPANGVVRAGTIWPK
ncbi:MAG: hypothetical protein D6803_07215, partial [Anaerolineae bacterium]